MVFIVLSPHPISGTKHTEKKNDCIGPLELFVTFRCYIYATLTTSSSFLLSYDDFSEPSAGGYITLSQIVSSGLITSHPLVMKWHNCTR